MTTFVIWGAGKNGRNLISILGKNRVSAVIDKSTKLQNTFYQGIPIIDFEQYMKKYMKNPIIITPAGVENEIRLALEEKRIYWSFDYTDNLAPLEGFFLQASVKNLIKKYKRKEKIYIYGYSVLGIILYDYFCAKDLECSLLLQSALPEVLRHYVKYDLKINVEAIEMAKENILLACKPDNRDYEWMTKKNLVVEEYYNLGIRKELYFNSQIELFKNIHKGKRCFIVATGPSLNVEDLDLLYKNQDICISVNGIFKIFDHTLWRPDYYMISDRLGVSAWKSNILSMDVKNKFIADVAWQFTDDEIADNIFKWHFIRKWDDGELPEFSDDFAKGAYMGYTIVYDGALQLAAYMGVREIYLLGVDCCQYDDPNKQHFVSNYCTERSYLKIDKLLLAYQSAKRYADCHGIQIFNATRGGNLEVFERVDFNKLF